MGDAKKRHERVRQIKDAQDTPTQPEDPNKPKVLSKLSEPEQQFFRSLRQDEMQTRYVTDYLLDRLREKLADIDRRQQEAKSYILNRYGLTQDDDARIDVNTGEVLLLPKAPAPDLTPLSKALESEVTPQPPQE